MTGKIEVAAINYGTADDGRKNAIITFAYEDDEGPLPSPAAFTVDVWVWDQGDPTATVNMARRTFHELTRDLAGATADWAREPSS